MNKWIKASEVSKIEFGDYIIVEQKRYGVDNEFYEHKVIGTINSNYWMDVPAIKHEGMKLHDETEDIVTCICCGVCEEEVIRYRIKDVHSVLKHTATEEPENKIVLSAEEVLKAKFPNAEELDWFKPIVECIKTYASQFKTKIADNVSDKINEIIKWVDENAFEESSAHLVYYPELKTFLKKLQSSNNR